MTELALAGPDTGGAPTRRRGRRRMLMLALPVLLAGGGFASSYLGAWSPLSLAGFGGHDASREAASRGSPATAFVDVPPIDITLPDARPRQLHLVVKLEVGAGSAATVERLLPRVLDAFNTFVTGIAPEAFERRGILEIMREELKTRVQLALETDTPVEVLIMEFALK